MDKQVLRKSIRNEVKKLTEKEKAIESDEIYRRIMLLDVLQKAHIVALFSSLPDEPSTDRLLKEISKQCKVVIPRIISDEMEFFPYNPDNIARGTYNIQEPTAGEAVSPSDIDVMIVPGVAFTQHGARMGRGKGFYDKYMSRKGFRAKKIGICFSCQLADRIPLDEHDVMMDIVVYKK